MSLHLHSLWQYQKLALHGQAMCISLGPWTLSICLQLLHWCLWDCRPARHQLWSRTGPDSTDSLQLPVPRGARRGDLAGVWPGEDPAPDHQPLPAGQAQADPQGKADLLYWRGPRVHGPHVPGLCVCFAKVASSVALITAVSEWGGILWTLHPHSQYLWPRLHVGLMALQSCLYVRSTPQYPKGDCRSQWT